MATLSKPDGKKPSTEKFHARRETIVRAAVETFVRACFEFSAAVMTGTCFQRTLEILQRTLKDTGASAKNGAEHLLAACNALTEYQLSGNTPLLRTSAMFEGLMRGG